MWGGHFAGINWSSLAFGPARPSAEHSPLSDFQFPLGGAINASLDGGTPIPVSAYSTQSSGAPTAGRRLIASGVAAGSHTVVLTVASGTCIFDFLQAAVLADPVLPATSYSGVGCACDYDTGQTYQIAPARLLWTLNQAGLNGDIDFYVGVFFALKRARNGGNFHQAILAADLVAVDVGGCTDGGMAEARGDSRAGRRRRPAGGSRDCAVGHGAIRHWVDQAAWQSRETAADTVFGISGTHPGYSLAAPKFAHTWLTLRPSVARRLVLPGRAPAAQGALVLRPAICGSTGGNWGYPDVHDIGNSGKDG
jgi:hypothetical protein